MMKQKSFTLIELLVVIVIIGILAGVIMISTSSSIDKANFAKAQAFSSTVQNELLSNLVSEWTFDEPEEGNITKDTWGNNHGIVVGATQVDDCVFGKCYSFDGTSDYIEIDDGDSLDLSDEITVSAFIKPNEKSDTYRTILAKGYASGENYQVRMDRTSNGNNVSFEVSVSGSYKGTPKIKINNNQWYHVVGLYNGNKISIFVNGVNGGSNPLSGSMDINIEKLLIGKNIQNEFWKGLIDDVRIYNLALSSSQIKQNYIAGLNSMLANGNISKQEYNERINNLAYNDNNE